LFLNLFYFTNLYPPAKQVLHSVTSEVKVFTVQAGAFIQKVAEGKGMFLFSLFKKDEAKEKEKYQEIKKRSETLSNRDPGLDRNKITIDNEKKQETKPKGGKHDGK
jgi:hypothetical protein